jgi:TatD DNase family protein
LHWFSGSVRALHAALDEGHSFSVNTAMIASPRGLNLVRKIPRDRLLTESDGPYVRIGNRPANPKDVGLVVSALARLWDLSDVETAHVISQNFERITQGHRRAAFSAVGGVRNVSTVARRPFQWPC